MWKSILLVGSGGFIGSALRYLIGMWIQKGNSFSFPWATFLINVTGCFLIGVLTGFLQKNVQQHQLLWLLLATGFCGGFTTFSSFALENVYLIKNTLSYYAMLYTIASIVVGILLCRFGIWLIQ